MRLRLGIPAMLLAFVSQMAFAQTSDWAVVKQLLPGQTVKVETAGGKTRSGSVRSVSEGAIQIGNDEVVKRQEVQRILLRSPGHHYRNALIGLAIGGGFGLAVGASCKDNGWDPSKGVCMASGAAVFGGIGAGIGALLPSPGKWHEVYRRP